MKFSAMQEFAAELLGTMVLILFGCGVVAMVVLFASKDPVIPGQIVNGGYTNITLGWGFAVLMGIFMSGAISGAHLNPAVTIALAATGRHPWAKVPHYIAAQFIGAFLGAAIVFAVYHAKWLGFDPALDHTTGIFSTFPAVPGFWPGFIDQVVGTALLMGLILAIGDKLANPAGPRGARSPWPSSSWPSASASAACTATPSTPPVTSARASSRSSPASRTTASPTAAACGSSRSSVPSWAPSWGPSSTTS